MYIDDVLISGPTIDEHLKLLEEVLKRMKKAGLKLCQDKCSFMSPSVTYLGYKIDADGLHPLPEKIEAIVEAPSPTNVTQLKSYLGLLCYYSRFLPNLTFTLSSLYRLLRRNVKWKWTSKKELAFASSKRLLTSSEVLTHFDPNLPVVLSCDASAYSIGAVLAHRLPDGSERPVGYVSRTLAPSEAKYSQIEKEGLACIFGVKKFHAYLYGHHFTLYTDHLPLKSLFKEHSNIPLQASGRIQRWSLLLTSYEYTIAYQPTQKHGNADAMSRLPLKDIPVDVPVPQELVLLMETLWNSLITDKDICEWTKKDPLLSIVYRHIQFGWPCQVSSKLQPFSEIRKNYLLLMDVFSEVQECWYLNQVDKRY